MGQRFIEKRKTPNVFVRSRFVERILQFLNSQKKSVSVGVVCASAGNHAQGVAYTCNEMKIPATIFMPITTPQQKIGQVRFFGGDYVTIKLVGDTFDASAKAAQEFTLAEKRTLY